MVHVKDNQMKASAKKCHLLVTWNSDLIVNIRKLDIKNSKEKKLLGVKIHKKLSIENYTSSLCKEASQKLHVLFLVVNYMDLIITIIISPELWSKIVQFSSTRIYLPLLF